MTEIELHQLLSSLLAEAPEVEHEYIELKISGAREFGQYLSALSNGACLKNKNCGYLIFGISNNYEIVGTTVRRGELERAGIRAKIHPRIDYSCHNFLYKNKPVILVSIPAAKGEPTTFDGKAYARIGEDKTSLKNLSSEQIKKIYNSGTDWSAQIVTEATFEDLDPEAVKKACEKIKEKKPNLANQTDYRILLDKGRITIEGKITRATLLLLGKSEKIHFLSPAQAEIIHRLVGWNLAPNEVTSKTFYPPFLLTLNDIWREIRNNKIKVFTNNSLYPEPIDKYDVEAVLEALNNCLAHQDYTENKRIVLCEKPDRLIFESAGNFFDGKVEDYIEGIRTPKKYRNKFLADAMRELDIIDIEGSGINKIYRAQIKKFFPAPDYNIDNDEVSVTIYGKIIDERFSQILMERDLNLTTAVLLDRVQKGLPINDDAARLLKKQNLIEGRKPRYFIDAEIAAKAGQVIEYIHDKGQNNEFYKKLILDHIKLRPAKKTDISRLLLKKLPDSLTPEQKTYRINNLIQSLRKSGKIKNHGSDSVPIWKIAN